MASKRKTNEAPSEPTPTTPDAVDAAVQPDTAATTDAENQEPESEPAAPAKVVDLADVVAGCLAEFLSPETANAVLGKLVEAIEMKHIVTIDSSSGSPTVEIHFYEFQNSASEAAVLEKYGTNPPVMLNRLVADKIAASE